MCVFEKKTLSSGRDLSWLLSCWETCRRSERCRVNTHLCEGKCFNAHTRWVGLHHFSFFVFLLPLVVSDSVNCFCLSARLSYNDRGKKIKLSLENASSLPHPDSFLTFLGLILHLYLPPAWCFFWKHTRLFVCLCICSVLVVVVVRWWTDVVSMHWSGVDVHDWYESRLNVRSVKVDSYSGVQS